MNNEIDLLKELLRVLDDESTYSLFSLDVYLHYPTEEQSLSTGTKTKLPYYEILIETERWVNSSSDPVVEPHSYTFTEAEIRSFISYTKQNRPVFYKDMNNKFLSCFDLYKKNQVKVAMKSKLD